MQNEYEQELKARWQHLKQQGRIQAMRALVEEETSMPYIPASLEAWLLECRDELDAMEEKPETVSAIRPDTVESYLFAAADKQMSAVRYLTERNLRDHVEMVRRYFLWKDRDRFAAALLLDGCIAQSLMDTFEWTMSNGSTASFIPQYLERPVEADGFVLALHYLRQWFEGQEPQFYQMCMDVLIQESYLEMPVCMEEEDGYGIALAVARYVYRAWRREDEWERFYQKECGKSVQLLDLEIEMIEKA